jgi:hypothetical protein
MKSRLFFPITVIGLCCSCRLLSISAQSLPVQRESDDDVTIVHSEQWNMNNSTMMQPQYQHQQYQRQQMTDNIETVTTAAAIAATTWWTPKASDELTWQWQLQNSNKLDMRFDVDMYDVDLFDVTDAAIAALHKRNKIVVCYFSAGSYEAYRDDWSDYFDFIQPDIPYTGTNAPFANKMAEWEGERWLDIRRIDLLGPIMKSRLQYAVDRKCDAVEPDNMDAYDNNKESGLQLTESDQLAYNRFIATEAHNVGLSVGLKNDVGQLADLVNDYDFAVNEQCFEEKECSEYKIFTDMDKAVFGVEYSGRICSFCTKAKRMKLSWMKKREELDPWRQGCDDRLTRWRCWWSYLFI